jgi:hypothetical protein
LGSPWAWEDDEVYVAAVLGDWFGAVLATPPDDENRPMLHDEFFDSYPGYRERSRPAP